MKKSHQKTRSLAISITLILILASCLAVFYFGWIQFRLNADEYGIIYTKTRGWDDDPIINGEFTWRWEALLPTNLTMHIVKATPQSHTIDKAGTLPSGELYGSMIGEESVFRWACRIGVNYRVRPDTLPNMYKQGMGEEGVEGIFMEYNSRLEDAVARIIGEEIAYPDLKTLQKAVNLGLSSIDKRIEIISITVLNWVYPDRELYEETKKLTIENLQNRQKILAEIEGVRLRQLDVEDAKINILSRYGALLTEYPVLLDLFALDINPSDYLLP